MAKKNLIKQAYDVAAAQFAELGVDVAAAERKLLEIPLSIQCWQGDDVGGFEHLGESSSLGDGLAVTGNYPGKARNPEELRADMEKMLSYVPGQNRIALHACYAEFGGGKFVDRDAIVPKHFANWIDWAKQNKVGLDFNPTFFSHPKVTGGCTLSAADKGVRRFWIEHGLRSREISRAIGKALGSSVLDNFWIPDGSKDTPEDRLAPRKRLEEALDECFAKKYPASLTVDSVESKLFGMGCESYTVGSHEFYMGYAVSRGKFVCLDSGHFHPTEVISDKLTAIAPFVPGIALHVSRPVRWDSDHVVCLDDETRRIAYELVRNGLLPKTRIGLDYFDASINRVAAWTIGARNFRKALLIALLTPECARKAEAEGDFTGRLAMQEDFRMLPFGAIWNGLCEKVGVLPDGAWLFDCKDYEKRVTSRRG